MSQQGRQAAHTLHQSPFFFAPVILLYVLLIPGSAAAEPAYLHGYRALAYNATTGRILALQKEAHVLDLIDPTSHALIGSVPLPARATALAIDETAALAVVSHAKTGGTRGEQGVRTLEVIGMHGGSAGFLANGYLYFFLLISTITDATVDH